MTTTTDTDQTVTAIRTVVTGHVFNHTTEDGLQSGLAEQLVDAGLPAVRPGANPDAEHRQPAMPHRQLRGAQHRFSSRGGMAHWLWDSIRRGNDVGGGTDGGSGNAVGRW